MLSVFRKRVLASTFAKPILIVALTLNLSVGPVYGGQDESEEQRLIRQSGESGMGSYQVICPTDATGSLNAGEDSALAIQVPAAQAPDESARKSLCSSVWSWTKSLCTSTVDCVKQNAGVALTTCGIASAAGYAFYNGFTAKAGSVLLKEVSRGCTYAIQYVAAPLICLPACKNIMNWVGATKIGSALGLDRGVDLHKVFVFVFVTAGGVHAACRIALDPTGIFLTQEGATGALMWVAILGPLGWSLFYGNSETLKAGCTKVGCTKELTYSQRVNIHKIGAAACFGLYAIHHGLNLLPWAAAPFGEEGLDFIVGHLPRPELLAQYFPGLDYLLGYLPNTYDTEITRAEISGEKILLEIGKPRGMRVRAGEVVNLKLTHGYHPFTVGSAKGVLKFFISRARTDTKILWGQVERGEIAAGSPIQIQGSYYSSSHGIKAGPLVTVTGGAGGSVAAAMAENLEGTSSGITLMHSDRGVPDFTPFLDALKQAKENGVNIQEVHLFFTGPAEQVPDLRQKITELEDTFAGTADEAVVRSPSEEVVVGVPTDEILAADDSAERDVEQGLVAAPSPRIILHTCRIGAKELAPVLLPNGDAAKPHVVISGSANFAQEIRSFCVENGMKYTVEAFKPR